MPGCSEGRGGGGGSGSLLAVVTVARGTVDEWKRGGGSGVEDGSRARAVCAWMRGGKGGGRELPRRGVGRGGATTGRKGFRGAVAVRGSVVRGSVMVRVSVAVVRGFSNARSFGCFPSLTVYLVAPGI